MTRIVSIFPLVSLLIICLLFGCGKKDKNPAGANSEPGSYDFEVSAAARQATISWKTNLATISGIEYGPSPNYGYQARNRGTARFEHQIKISGLLPETEYFFKVIGEKTTGGNFITASEGLAIKIDPCLKQVKVGEPFTLDVWVENVTHLSEVGLRFHFDPTVLKGSGISPGDFMGDNILFLTNTSDLEKGIMDIGMGIKRSLPGGERKEVNGSGIVARLSFSVKAAGETRITINRERILSLKKEDGYSSVDGFDDLFLGYAQIRGYM